MARHYQTTPLAARIARHIQLDHATGCWLWTGACSKKRRGQHRPHIREGRRGTPMVNVARVVCTERHGPPPTLFHEAGHT